MITSPVKITSNSTDKNKVFYRLMLPKDIIEQLTNKTSKFNLKTDAKKELTSLNLNNVKHLLKPVILTPTQDFLKKTGNLLKIEGEVALQLNFQLNKKKPKITKSTTKEEKTTAVKQSSTSKNNKSNIDEPEPLIPLKKRIVHLLAVEPRSVKELSQTLNKSAGQITKELLEIGNSRFSDDRYQLKPEAYKYVYPHQWTLYTPKEKESVIKNVSIAYEHLRLPADAPERKNLLPNGLPESTKKETEVNKKESEPVKKEVNQTNSNNSSLKPTSSNIPKSVPVPIKDNTVKKLSVKRKKPVSKPSSPKSSQYDNNLPFRSHSFGKTAAEIEKEKSILDYLEKNTQQNLIYESLTKIKLLIETKNEEEKKKMVQDDLEEEENFKKTKKILDLELKS
ncbi:hypothetical protein HK099_007931, partial [Clydaea vesicula]